ncbi:MAG: oligosaccharide flippase family protein, partial [Cellulophaga sp.]|uniref:oligosaccharide flippase family protein n=1 Tax=Cellulophaga sp. TaxID=1972202 RepID=UPI0032640A59
VGISNAIVYNKNISFEQLSSVYWVNVFSGVFFTALLFVISPLISSFYDVLEVNLYIKIVCFSFIILSTSRLYKFLFLKEVLLKTVAVSEIFSYLFGLILMSILIKLDYGIISFIYSIVGRSVVQSLYLIIYGRKIFIPSFKYNHKSLKSLFRYGAFNLGQNLTVYFTSQLDTLIIGKVLGLEILGVYNIAKNLAIKPLQLISPVVSKITFPLMSKFQDSKLDLKNIYLLSIKHLFSVIVVVYIIMAFLAKDLILTIYGDQWVDSVIIFRLLCLMYIVVSVGNPIGSLILATGKVNWGFYWNLSMLLVVSCLIFLSSQLGLIFIVVSLIFYHILSFIISFNLITKKIIPIRIIEIFLTIMIHLLMMILPILLLFYLSTFISNTYLRIFGLPITGISSYILCMYFLDREYFYKTKKNIT